MKKKKILKTAIKVIIVIFIILILLSVFNLFVLRKITAKKSFNKTITAITSGDYTNDFYYCDIYGTKKKYLDLSEWGYYIASKCEIKVIDYDIKYNSLVSEVKIKVTYPDVTKLIEEVTRENKTIYTKEEINQMLIEKIENEEFEYKKEIFNINMVQEGLHWYIVENSKLINVYTGGTYEKAAEIIS